MCGFCGFFNRRGSAATASVIDKMSVAITHRGPDGAAIFIDGPLAMGHRRLYIMDLTENARQPMESADGRYVLVYNGEIYGFRELAAELAAKGYQSRSTGDTEVLLHAYMEWGEACVRRFNGMFSFVVYDRQKHQLFCARDRYGIKPFYYAQIGESFLFASEQKAIFEHPAFRHQLDYDGITEYFTFQNILSTRTIEKQIKTLAPGHTLTLEMGTEDVFPRQYWDFHFAQEADRGEKVYAEELDFLLEQAVNRQLVSDAEIGSFLSGGMDSGTITCIASRIAQKNNARLKTFTCGFDMTGASDEELRFEERRKAEIMAHTFQTEHYERVLQYCDVSRALPQICWHNEEPRVGPTYTNYCISGLASKFVKVAFSGTGGDELFGGYPWRYYRGMAAKGFDEFAEGYYLFWQRLIPTRFLEQALAPIRGKSSIDPRELFRGVFAGHQNPLKTPEDYINHCLYFEAKTFLPGMLMVEDKLSMAHGLEGRVPMLDNDLVDFAQRLPVKYKLSDLTENLERVKNDPNIKRENYYLRTNHGKYLLRKTMEKYIPESIDRADKQGFSAPDASWFRNECRDLVDSVVYNNSARLWEILDPNTVRALVSEHMDGTANRRLLIWSLLNFDQLLKTWF